MSFSDSYRNIHFRIILDDPDSYQNHEVVAAKTIYQCIDSKAKDAVISDETGNATCPYQVPCPFRGPVSKLSDAKLEYLCLYNGYNDLPSSLS